MQSKDIKNLKYSSFAEFKLKENIQLGLTEFGYTVPTPVQEECIPLVFAHKSVIARAKNGTGKTGAFLIPLLNEIDEEARGVQGVILVPVRELAQQVEALAQKFSKFTKIRIEYFIGGTSAKEDHAKLEEENVQLAVCTPGRLKDLVKRRPGLLEGCQFFVLDEADKLLEEKFEADIEEIIRHLGKQCAMLMFSATFPVRIRYFKERHMPRAEVINLMDELMLLGLTHYYMFVDEEQKMRAIYKIYGTLIINQCIVFCRSNRRTETLSRKLKEHGYENEFLHSDLRSAERIRIFERFRRGEFRTLVGSNMISRGIDVQAVNVVINFDFPSDSSTYLHRIGRSGRYGQIGLAINLITEKDQESVVRIERELDTKIDPMPEQVDESLYR